MRSALAALALAALALAPACGPREEGVVVARIDGEPVIFADFEAYVRTQAGDDWMGLEGDVLRQLFAEFLEELLLARLARDQGLADADADRVSALGQLRERLEAEPVRDDEARRFLEEHPEELRRPERLVLGQLLLPDRALALEAERAIAAEGDFDAVARQLSARPGVVYGGYLQDMTFQDLPPPFRDELFALAPGEVSGVLEADYGFHLFHVREHRSEEVLPLEQAMAAAKARLDREHADRAIAAMLERARERYAVEVLEWNLPFVWRLDATPEALDAAP